MQNGCTKKLNWQFQTKSGTSGTHRLCNNFQVRGFVLLSEIIWIPEQPYVRLVRGLIDLICRLLYTGATSVPVALAMVTSLTVNTRGEIHLDIQLCSNTSLSSVMASGHNVTELRQVY